MAEEIQKKKISELPSAVYLSDEDVMPVVQGSGSSEATKKVDIGLVGSTVAESKTFLNLDTTSKTLVGAINEVNSSLGNVPSADEISYDNTSSGLSASDVQGAIDEIAQGGSGGSTVTVTQIQSEGTKIATITVDSVDTDLYAPNGGGGASAFEDLTDVDIDPATLTNGQVPVYNSSSAKWENGTISGGSGHIILDDEGTSLPQRDDLQFKGAYSEDDSANEKTVVNVVREMTKAEFDELTKAEKMGLINITDVTGSNDDRFQPVIYSEDEREIGVWTDGKPLYQKTVSLTNITIAVSGGYSYDISSWNVDTIVKNPEGFITLSNDTDLRTVPFGVLGNYATDITSTRSAVQFLRKGGDLTCNRVVFTLTYTKTTDTAGSGQWTPQGVPAHHYSEDEQVIGTWIDGSTIYEKTYTSSTYYHTTEVAILDLSSLAYDKIILLQVDSEITLSDQSTICFNPSGENAYINSDKIVYAKQSLAAQQSGRTMMSYITVRYTKSST